MRSNKRQHPRALATVAVMVAAPLLAASLLLIGLAMLGFDLSDRDYGKQYRNQ
ncbi:hypothetical protein ALP54_04016 [Pseudomonas amygdali pv. lachrymans]|nr:hypothetical protein ALP54_04016 [Pseudomonas amygdali pv. lachrymans]